MLYVDVQRVNAKLFRQDYDKYSDCQGDPTEGFCIGNNGVARIDELVEKDII